MTQLYELAVLGSPSDQTIKELENAISEIVNPFALHIGKEIGLAICPDSFEPTETRSSAAVYFGPQAKQTDNLAELIRRSVPILPVVSDIKKVHEEIPPVLHPLNCLSFNEGGIRRIATALLECAGLLPRQRRVFLSYRRDEARQAAVQLFDALSARQFDVFLDSHGIAPSDDFQATLWHRLCDSDVLIMLDTPNYFESRWTEAEFGRALSKCIGVLRVGWPDSTPSRRTETLSRVEIVADELDETTGRLNDMAIDRICHQLESVRSESHAVRNLNLVGEIRIAVERQKGEVTGVGINRSVSIRLPNQREIVVYPSIGVPTSVTLQNAAGEAHGHKTAVIYDHIGLHPHWQDHLDWLGSQITSVRWIKAAETGWQISDWYE